MKWFDRAYFEGGDVLSDFCAQAGIDPLPAPDKDSNPSIGGNLLYFKLLANARQHDFLRYVAMRDIAGAHADLRVPFHIPRKTTSRLRAESPYNASLSTYLGAPALREWDDKPDLPQHDRLESDCALIEAADRTGAASWLRGALAKRPLPDLVWGD